MNILKLGIGALTGGWAGLGAAAKSDAIDSAASNSAIGRAYKTGKQVGNILGEEGEAPKSLIQGNEGLLGANTDLYGSMGYDNPMKRRMMMSKYNLGGE